MTVMAERMPQMSVEEFEELASAAPETVRLEFIAGRIGVKKVPDGNHNEIVEWLRAICMQHQPAWALYGGGQGLRVERYRGGRARPDGSLAQEAPSRVRGSGSIPMVC
jgi:Uma2 family endonuclease